MWTTTAPPSISPSLRDRDVRPEAPRSADHDHGSIVKAGAAKAWFIVGTITLILAGGLSAWLGFNIGFGLGVFAFGLLCLLVATHDFKLVERIGAIRPLTIAVSATYFAISIGFFFSGPAIITGIATVCFTIAAVLSVAGRRGEAARSADHHPGRRP